MFQLMVSENNSTLTLKFLTRQFQIAELSNSHVHIRDKENVNKIINKMIQDGASKLQVWKPHSHTMFNPAQCIQCINEAIHMLLMHGFVTLNILVLGHLTLCYLKYACSAPLNFCWFFSKSIFFEKLFQEYHQSVKQFGSTSSPTVCRAWFGSKLFAKVISKWN